MYTARFYKMAKFAYYLFSLELFKNLSFLYLLISRLIRYFVSIISNNPAFLTENVFKHFINYSF